MTDSGFPRIAGFSGRNLIREHIEVVRGDLTVPETLDGCIEEIHSVFLVWTASATAVAPALANRGFLFAVLIGLHSKWRDVVSFGYILDGAIRPP